MSHATTFGSLLGAARLVGVKPTAPQADYDRVRLAGTPVDAILRARKAREARFAAMRAGK